MKNLLPLLFLGLSLASCSKGSDDPSPAPAPAPAPAATMVATWEWESETLVSVFKDGRPTKTESKTVVPKSVYITYGTNGYATATINGVVQPAVAYTPMQVGVPVASTQKGFAVTNTLTELTPTHMTLVEVNEDASVKYTTTDTYKR